MWGGKPRFGNDSVTLGNRASPFPRHKGTIIKSRFHSPCCLDIFADGLVSWLFLWNIEFENEIEANISLGTLDARRGVPLVFGGGGTTRGGPLPRCLGEGVPRVGGPPPRFRGTVPHAWGNPSPTRGGPSPPKCPFRFERGDYQLYACITVFP